MDNLDIEKLADKVEAEEAKSELPQIAKSNSTIDNFANSAIDKTQEKFNRGDIDINEGAKDIAHAIITKKAIDEEDDNNTEFLDESVKLKQKELTKSFEAGVLKGQAEKITASNKKAEAFYIMFRPILEFDFSNLRKVKKVKINSKENDVRTRKNEYTYTEEKQKTYEDRSYGIALMVLMLTLLTIPYCVVTIVLSVFNAINEIFMQIANFGMPALWICSCFTGIVILALIIYVIIIWIQSTFGIVIIP